jgi:hypothetical protein
MESGNHSVFNASVSFREDFYYPGGRGLSRRKVSRWAVENFASPPPGVLDGVALAASFALRSRLSSDAPTPFFAMKTSSTSRDEPLAKTLDVCTCRVSLLWMMEESVSRRKPACLAVSDGFAATTLPCTGVPRGTRIWPWKRIGSSSVASKVSPERALALQSGEVSRTTIRVPVGRAEAAKAWVGEIPLSSEPRLNGRSWLAEAGWVIDNTPACREQAVARAKARPTHKSRQCRPVVIWLSCCEPVPADKSQAGCHIPAQSLRELAAKAWPCYVFSPQVILSQVMRSGMSPRILSESDGPWGTHPSSHP